MDDDLKEAEMLRRRSRLEDLNEFFLKHTHGDEFAMVLASGAIFDDFLASMIKEFLRDGSITDELLARNGPIDAYGNRLKLAWALGLLNDRQYKDLRQIGKIRNEFAHRWRDTSLSAQSDRIRELQTRSPGVGDDSDRGIFVSCIAGLLGDITNTNMTIIIFKKRLQDITMPPAR